MSGGEKVAAATRWFGAGERSLVARDAMSHLERGKSWDICGERFAIERPGANTVPSGYVYMCSRITEFILSTPLLPISVYVPTTGRLYNI